MTACTALWRALRSGGLLLGLLAAATAGAETLRVSSPAGPVPPLPAEQLRELESGRVVMLPEVAAPGSVLAPIEALVVFEQPRRRAWRLLTQTGRQAEFRPELSTVETLERADGYAVDVHRMKILFVRIDYRLRTHFDYEGQRIWWQLDPDAVHDVESIEGSWQLHELDPQRTLGRFGSQVRVGGGSPAFLEQYAARKNIPTTLDRVRRWVNSNGTYRP